MPLTLFEEQLQDLQQQLRSVGGFFDKFRAYANRQFGYIHDNMMTKEEFYREVYRIQSQLDGAKQEVAELKQDVIHLKQDIVEIKQDVTHLKQDVAELKQDVVGAKQEISQLKKEVVGLQHDNDYIKQLLILIAKKLDVAIPNTIF